MIKTVAYISSVEDGMVVIRNSENDSIKSNNPQELLDFMARNYGNDAYNRKVTWRLDTFASVIVKRLGMPVCKQLIDIDRDRESNFTFDNDKPKLIDKPNQPTDGTYRLFFNPGVILGLQVGKIKPSFFYSLYDFFEEDIEITDPKEVATKCGVLVDTFFAMGMNPLKLSSPVGIWEQNIMSHMDIPTLASMPDNLPEDQCDELVDLAVSMKKREWKTSFAVGLWKEGEAFDYDISSCYASQLAKIYSTNYAKYQKVKDNIPEDAHWGVFKGKIQIFDCIKVSPIPYNHNGTILFPIGSEWYGTITLPEIKFIRKWNIGEFTLDEGYSWRYFAPVTPFEIPLKRIYEQRMKGGLTAKLAKRILAASWGKLAQQRNGTEPNKWFNPIMALQVETAARMQVANFIYSNNIQSSTLAIGVDGVLSEKPVKLPDKNGMGCWRLNPPSSHLILSPARVFSDTAKPNGLYLHEMIDLINADSKGAYYKQSKIRRLTLTEAASEDRLEETGELVDRPVTVDLLGDKMIQDCDFDDFPRCGNDLLQYKHYGKPIKIKNEGVN